VGATNACEINTSAVPRLQVDEAAALELLLVHKCLGTTSSSQRLVTPRISKTQMQPVEALTTAAAEDKPNLYATAVTITKRHAITRSYPSSLAPTNSNRSSLRASEETAVVVQKDYNSGQSHRADEKVACTDSTVCLTQVVENVTVPVQPNNDAREVPVLTEEATVAWCSDCDALQSPQLVERVLSMLTENSPKTSMSKNCLPD